MQRVLFLISSRSPTWLPNRLQSFIYSLGTCGWIPKLDFGMEPRISFHLIQPNPFAGPCLFCASQPCIIARTVRCVQCAELALVRPRTRSRSRTRTRSRSRSRSLSYWWSVQMYYGGCANALGCVRWRVSPCTSTSSASRTARTGRRASCRGESPLGSPVAVFFFRGRAFNSAHAKTSSSSCANTHTSFEPTRTRVLCLQALHGGQRPLSSSPRIGRSRVQNQARVCGNPGKRRPSTRSG